MNQISKSVLSICLFLTTSVSFADSPTESKMISLFDGKDLAGWDGDPRLWTVEQGVIRGETTSENKSNGNTFLVCKKGTFNDFELRLSYRLNATNNSGIQYRSKRIDQASNNWVVRGYQHEIRNEINMPDVSGFIYSEGGLVGEGRLCLCGEKAVRDADGGKTVLDTLVTAEQYPTLFKLDDWNDVIIIAKGNHIQHFLNEKQILDYTDHSTLALKEGVIALQLHGGKPMWAEYKDIRIRELPPAQDQGEPTNADEAAAQKAKAEAELDAKYQAWVETLTPARQAWEKVLQSELGGFYLPIHQREKVAGKSNAWDFVDEDPALPRVLLIGDSVSRAYTQTVRKQLAGKANVHRAPANCGPTTVGLKKIDVWLGEGKWDIVHFNFGIHDRNTPIADYADRLDQLIERIKQTGATLIWANTTPLPDVAGKYTAASVVQRNAAAAKVMAKHKIVINDLFRAISPRLAEMQNPNDCHFSGAGNTFLGQKVATFLEQQLEAAELH